MKQYCRYCAFCTNGDTYYCGEKEKVLSSDDVKRVNHCSEYVYSVLGDVDTGKQYKPQRKRKKGYEQIKLEMKEE